MAKWAQGPYTPVNPLKYIGNKTPRYRSGWELMFFRFCDHNPSVTQWASEAIAIPYRNPFTGKNTIYIPDIFMVYNTKDGNRIAEVVEIKPSVQTNLQEARSQYDKASAVLNMHKWRAASAYCKQMGFNFRVISERELFYNGKPPKK